MLRTSVAAVKNAFLRNSTDGCSILITNKLLNTTSAGIHTVKMETSVFGSSEEASPLIIMHGLFGSKQNWRGISKALESKLSPKRKIYTVDARNHGNSPHTSEHTYKALSSDIAALLKEENISRAAVMGHSMGGRAMMHFALEYPNLVESAIICDISPISISRDFAKMEELFLAMKNVQVAANTSMPQARVIVEGQIKKAVEDQETVDFIMLNLKKAPNGEFGWGANVEALHKNFANIGNFPSDIIKNKKYSGPVMFIAGSRSNFVNPDDWPAIQDIFPNSEIHWLDAGHLVHFDQPAKFLELVIQFVNRNK